MARVLRMPGVAANTTEAVLSEWLVEEFGDFAAADAIATVETEKAAVEVEADAEGRILKTLVPPGAQVEVGDPIAVLGDPGEEVDDVDALLESLGVTGSPDVVVPERRDVPTDPESAAPLAEAAPDPDGSERSTEQLTGRSEASERPEPSSSRPANGRVWASPLARKVAKDHGLPIEEVEGSGPRGRILRRDVDAAVAHREVESETVASDLAEPAGVRPPAPVTLAAPFEEVPHSRIRLATARRLTLSKREAPHFYVRRTVRADRLVALRAELNDGAEVKVSINDLVVKAVAVAHQQVPDMNVTWTDEAMRRYATVDVAVAVATERGLMTPVVRDVGSRTVTSVASSVRDVAGRAREGRLKQDELEGGSISVTNLGMHGVEEFAAIINPPHAAILAVGATRDEPVVEDGAVVPGTVMSLTLSVDHRAVDGVLAARWMGVLVDLLEHPLRILA